MSTAAAGARSVAVPRRAIAPIACGCAAVGLAATMLFVDPSDQSVLPPCPFHTLTGLWCPGCGLTRASHALIHADPARALGFNLLAPAILFALVVSWLSWLLVSLGRPPVQWPTRIPTVGWIALGAITIAFTVARNTTAFAALAP